MGVLTTDVMGLEPGDTPKPDDDAAPELESGLPSITDKLLQARQNGNDWVDVDSYLAQKRDQAHQFGYSDEDIDKFLGYNDPGNRQRAIGHEAAALLPLNNVDNETAPFADKLLAASGGLFNETKAPTDQALAAPVPKELRSEYANALLTGEAKDANHFADFYTTSIYDAAIGNELGIPHDFDAIDKQRGTTTDQLAKQLPDAKAIVDYSIGLAQLNTGGSTPDTVYRNLLQHYVETGERPDEAFQRAQSDRNFLLEMTTPQFTNLPSLNAEMQQNMGVTAPPSPSMWRSPDEVARIQSDFFSKGLPNVGRAAFDAFGGGMQDVYNWGVNNGILDKDGSTAPLNNVNKLILSPVALLAGGFEAGTAAIMQVAHELGQDSLGRALAGMVESVGGTMGTASIGVHAMNPEALQALDNAARTLIQSVRDDRGSGPGFPRNVPLNKPPGAGEISPPVSGAPDQLYQRLPDGMVFDPLSVGRDRQPIRIADESVRIDDGVASMAGHNDADTYNMRGIEDGIKQRRPEWFEPEFQEKVVHEREQKGVDGTPYSPPVQEYMQDPEIDALHRTQFTRRQTHELFTAAEEGRDPTDWALSPYDESHVPRRTYDYDLRNGPVTDDIFNSPNRFTPGFEPLRPTLKTEPRKWKVLEDEAGNRVMHKTDLKPGSIIHGSLEGEQPGGELGGEPHTLTVREATVKEVEDYTKNGRDYAEPPELEPGNTRLWRSGNMPEGKFYKDRELAEFLGNSENPLHYLDTEIKGTGRRQGFKPTRGGGFTLPEDVASGAEELGFEPTVPQVYRKHDFWNTRDDILKAGQQYREALWLAKNREDLQSRGWFVPREDTKPEATWLKERPPEFKDPRWWQSDRTVQGVPVQLPMGLNGWVPPHIAETIDRYATMHKVDGTDSTIKAVNRGLIRTLFISPVQHINNVGAHAIVGRGLDNLTPQGLKSLFADGEHAVHEVLTMGPKYQQLQRMGAGFQYARVLNRGFSKVIHEQMIHEIAANPGRWAPVAKALGYTGVPQLTKAVYDTSSKMLWATSDIMLMQRVLEYERKGLSTRDAIWRAEREIPNYRVPVRVLGNRKISELLTGNKYLAFGRYDYGRAAAIGNMARDMVGADGLGVGAAMHGVSQAVVMGLLAYYGGPWISSMVQKMTGNASAYFNSPGPFSVLNNLNKVREGDFGAALAAIVTMSPALRFGTSLLENMNPYGKPLVNGHKTWPGWMADIVRATGSMVPPVDYLQKAITGGPKGTEGGFGPQVAKMMTGLNLPSADYEKRVEEAKKRAISEAQSEERKDELAKMIRNMLGGPDVPGGAGGNSGRTRGPSAIEQERERTNRLNERLTPAKPRTTQPREQRQPHAPSTRGRRSSLYVPGSRSALDVKDA